jgi:chemotaxis protein MotB
MSSKHAEPVIIIKKGGHHKHGHHGGAWKVAYADFVTAMMAFFLVMWIVGQKPEVKAAVAGYFRDPGAFDGGRGVLPGVEGTAAVTPEPPSPEAATAALEKAAEELRDAVASRPEFAAIADRIEISVTDEGLRIELREAPDDGFFASGSAEMKPQTVELLRIIGSELGQISNKVAVEGHTDSRPYPSPTDGYTNWELSADRANAARRVLVKSGLKAGQVEAVRGYADTRLRTAQDPLNPSNRRISIIVRRA